ncbi:alpha/beta fold hydrolase [Ramlibacter sp. AN1015]|uniref:RBBP9/YdeN family alpha/beta hydrolase n=1 Tax=Ramlibacter sp. AN1015 TaxID=3133428 RepID=UPI0030BF6FB5
MKSSNVLILPGWQGSGPGHWQSLWEQRHGYRRVEQHDWMQALRGDWIARLEDVLLERDEPAVLVAHSLGCVLAAAWAAHTRHPTRVKAALLVAPADPELPQLRASLHSWAPVPLQRLPFPATLVASRDDPYCAFERARLFAHAWGAQFMDYGEAGHINAESGLGSWPEGHVLLQALAND